jgi:hypothetical protein
MKIICKFIWNNRGHIRCIGKLKVILNYCTYGRHSSLIYSGSKRDIVTTVPMYNFINSLFRINLAMLAKFAIDYS